MKSKGIGIGITLLVLMGCTKQGELISQPQSQTIEDRPETIEESATPSSTPTQIASPSPKGQNPSPIRQLADQSPKPPAFSIISLPSTFHSDDKRSLSSVDTIVIHSVYNPTASDPFAISSIKKVFDDEEVSSHFVITRDGKIYQLVGEEFQAWHAGVSTLPSPDNREKVNVFSIGIELVGKETTGFTDAQYQSLTSLIVMEQGKLPIKKITGHADIAPGRKTDPWKFDWKRFETDLSKTSAKSLTILGTH